MMFLAAGEGTTNVAVPVGLWIALIMAAAGPIVSALALWVARSIKESVKRELVPNGQPMSTKVDSTLNEMTGLRTDMNGLRGDVGGLRTDVNSARDEAKAAADIAVVAASASADAMKALDTMRKTIDVLTGVAE